MKIRIQLNPKRSFLKNVSFMFVLYWGILVLWQNISGTETRGTADLLIKIGLLGYFVLFYLRQATAISVKVIPVFLLAIALFITATQETQFPLSNLIAYVYPILILLMVYGVGNRLEINRGQLLCFCNCVIGIVLYAAIYALIFCWDQFAGAFSVSSAYGNELSSFFVSNFEYGMYLEVAIICCLLCISLTPKMSVAQRFMYVTFIIILAANLILTFSRTTILSLLLVVAAYGFASGSKGRKWVLFTAAIIGGLLMVPAISDFVSNVVFKNNNLADRDVLLQQGVLYIQNGTGMEKLFGFGIYEPRLYFSTHFEHPNLHNAYLQVLMYFGYIGCISLVVFMLSQVIANIKLIRKDQKIGAVMLGLSLGAMLIMLTTTALVFSSTIDSFFLTMFFVLMPKYVRNSIYAGNFYD